MKEIREANAQVKPKFVYIYQLKAKGSRLWYVRPMKSKEEMKSHDPKQKYTYKLRF